MQRGDLGLRGRVLMAPGQPPRALPHPPRACVQEGQQAGERAGGGPAGSPQKEGKLRTLGAKGWQGGAGGGRAGAQGRQSRHAEVRGHRDDDDLH